MSAVAISMRNIVKRYGKVRALDGLDLTVAQGEVHAFLGPNGAGKTTAIRVLLGLIRPDSGESQLLGLNPWVDAVALHRRLAYVPGDMDLWPKLTGGEIIDLFGKLRGGLERRRRDELIELFDFDPTKKARSYSKGNRQKVGLISALASNVELLILDEPTSGLDPLMESVFQDCVSAARDEGRTVLLSSHILAEVEALGDSVSIIRSGRIVETGTLSDMRSLSRTSVSAITANPVTLEKHPYVHNLRINGDRLDFDVDNDGLDSAIGHLSAGNLVSLVCQPPTLEELFLRHYATPASSSPLS